MSDDDLSELAGSLYWRMADRYGSLGATTLSGAGSGENQMFYDNTLNDDAVKPL